MIASKTFFCHLIEYHSGDFVSDCFIFVFRSLECYRNAPLTIKGQASKFISLLAALIFVNMFLALIAS